VTSPLRRKVLLYAATRPTSARRPARTHLRARSRTSAQPRARLTNWTAITSLITAITAIGALIFTGLSLNATRDQVAIAQAQNAVAEQGQFTERYSKAVEQIGQQGADHLQVRLGGIYALESLAYDSPRDQPTILEVLTAFIRTTDQPRTIPGNTCPTRSVEADIQAALTVLGRRNPTFDRGSLEVISPRTSDFRVRAGGAPFASVSRLVAAKRALS
jgi:hypothetical protein